MKRARRPESDFLPGVNDWLRGRGWEVLPREGYIVDIARLRRHPDSLAQLLKQDGGREFAAVEVERSFGTWTQGLGQAALYQTFSHYSWLAIGIYSWYAEQGKIDFVEKIILPICARLGLGLLKLESDSASVEKEWLAPQRQSPTITVIQPETRVGSN